MGVLDRILRAGEGKTLRKLDGIAKAVNAIEQDFVDLTDAELRAMTGDEENYEAKATVLMENVRHHIEEEEGEMFPQVRTALGRKRLQELADEMQRVQATA